MRFGLIAALVLLLPLPACEVPIIVAAEANDGRMTGATKIEFPARVLLVSEQFGEDTYIGTMVGHISGRADIEVKNAAGEQCSGRANSDGKGQLICGSRVINFDAGEDQKAAFSGANYQEMTVEGVFFRSAFGWGKGANDRVLRHVLAARRNLTPQETRAIAKGE